MRIVSSLKEFAKALARHWVWTLVFILVLVPVLLGFLAPVRAKLATLPVVGKLFSLGA